MWDWNCFYAVIHFSQVPISRRKKKQKVDKQYLYNYVLILSIIFVSNFVHWWFVGNAVRKDEQAMQSFKFLMILKSIFHFSCEYPPELSKRSLMDADTNIKCSSVEDSRQEFSLSKSLHDLLWSRTTFFVCIIIVTIGIVLYFMIMKRRNRARMLKIRYSVLARLNDDDDHDDNVGR